MVSDMLKEELIVPSTSPFPLLSSWLRRNMVFGDYTDYGFKCYYYKR